MCAQTLDQIIGKSRNLVFFGGAGVSTESGIPDFRSGDGLYRAVTDYGYPPETVISRSFFDSHPEIFFDFYKKYMIFPKAGPNPAHKALALLENRGPLKAVITQNIDGLHQAAGSRVVHELHGSVHRNHCMACGASYSLAYILADGNNRDGIPRCGACGGNVRPDVVLYEESLDVRVLEAARAAIEGADTLIVGGTSLVVYPAAGLIQWFRGNHLVLLNKEATPMDSQADLVVREPIGEVLGALTHVSQAAAGQAGTVQP